VHRAPPLSSRWRVSGSAEGSRRQGYGVRPEIRHLLDGNGGVVRRADLTVAVPRHVLDWALSAGHLVRVAPEVYADPAVLGDPMARLHTALRYGGDNAALSHTTGLALWGLPLPPKLPVHLTTDDRQLSADPSLVVHRRRGFRAEPPMVVARAGLAVVRLERCLVDSWPLLEGYERRAPLIAAVQQRLTTAGRVRGVAVESSRIAGRSSLLDLTDLLASGCHSELESWGFLHVFSHPTLPPADRQLQVRIGDRRAYLDVSYPGEMVDVELDGSRYHFGGDRRERDMRRDAALVTAGWLVGPLLAPPAARGA
jgi:hypothetical protein